MAAVRWWNPGREYTVAHDGVNWHYADDAWFHAVVLWTGTYGMDADPLAEQFGEADEDAEYLWYLRIRKDVPVSYTSHESGLTVVCGCPAWEDALEELYNKPKRALRDGQRYGEILRRVPVADLEGVASLDWPGRGLAWMQDNRDRRALRRYFLSLYRGMTRAAAARRRRYRVWDRYDVHPDADPRRERRDHRRRQPDYRRGGTAWS